MMSKVKGMTDMNINLEGNKNERRNISLYNYKIKIEETYKTNTNTKMKMLIVFKGNILLFLDMEIKGNSNRSIEFLAYNKQI